MQGYSILHLICNNVGSQRVVTTIVSKMAQVEIAQVKWHAKNAIGNIGTNGKEVNKAH